ncbi:AAEL009843-PA [Aedes aegypti]|uniref:AAEL009843-PA n=2 Tax=Aedes aegypti TaxID=7159 RepID=A0A1S4FNH4_AEDAE|nr:trypsin-1 [Aedes aegypti]EAT38237.1 AAEL009843-PA [Aedes aegypti]
MVSFKLLIVIAIGATSLTKSVENNRIVGGTEAEAHEFPYQVSLQWNYTNGKPPKHFCGGSLIAESYVITAAHCTVSSADNDWLEVVAGEHDLLLSDENVQRRRVIKMFVHEKFNVEQVGPWDIAVLKLDEPFQLTSSVRLIELPAKGVLHHGKGVVSGWGGISTDFFPDMPNVLMKAELPILQWKECRDIWQDERIHESNVCAGTRDGLSNTCSGDSGGPLVQIKSGLFELVGIVSWGRMPCGSPYAPGVFTRVSYYTDWIKEQMTHDGWKSA